MRSFIYYNNQNKKYEMDRTCRTNGRKVHVKVSILKLEGKRPLGISRRGWEDNINRDLKETEVGIVD
jgi:hypothetical protein